MQPSNVIFPAGFVPVGEPVPRNDQIAELRARQIDHVIEEIKAPTNVEKIDRHFKEGKFARLWVAAYA